MAFDLLERNERDLYESLAPLTSTKRIIDDYDTTIYVLLMKFSMDPELDDTKSISELSDNLCFNTFLFLKKYLSSLVPYQLNLMPWKETKDIIPDRDRESLSPQEKVDEDRDILWG